MSKKRKALWVLAVLVVAAIPAYFWLFTESHVPDDGAFAIDLAKVRELAGTTGPAAIHFEQVAFMEVPSTGVVAGTGWDMVALTFYAYLLKYPDGKTVMVDTAMDAKTAAETSAKGFDAAAFERLKKAMAAASVIVVTHEHYDHIGGLATAPNAKELMAVAKVTKEQLSVPKKMDPLVFPAEALTGYAPLDYDRYTAVAPGVVLIKAAGHTPGSQIVYVKRADGAEYLFLGDVAWHQRNVDDVRTRARVVTMLMGEDRDGVVRQLKELNRISTTEKVTIVPGHDRPRIEALVAGGFLVPKFE